MSSGNRRIDDFGILADAMDDDLVLVSSANQTYTMRVKTLKDAVKAESTAAVTAATEAVTQAKKAQEDAEKAITDSEAALKDSTAAKEAAEQAKASAVSAENRATEAAQSSQAAQAAAETVLDSVDGLTPRVEKLEKDMQNVSIDPDDLGLEQDAETGFVYPTYQGVRSENGIPLAATGGGGGTGGLTYSISLTNALESRALTVVENQAAELQFNYSSVDEEGYDDGAGVGTILVDDVKVLTFSVEQGLNTVDIAQYLATGEHTVKVKVENSETMTHTLKYTVTLVALTMSTTLNPLATYSGAVTFYYTPVGTGEKTIHFLMDGVEIGTDTVASSGRSRSYVIPAQAHGGHIFEAYAEMTVGNVTVKSNVITLGMMWIEADNMASDIVSAFAVKEAKQGEALEIDYLAYDPTSETAAVTLSVIGPDGVVYSSKPLTVDRTPQTWNVNDYPMGAVTFKLAVRDAYIEKVVQVADSGVNIERITDSLVLDFDAAGRSNQEENPESWSAGPIEASFESVAFAGADGWLTDADGSQMLRLLPGSSMFLPFNLFETDHRDNGVTVEVEMATHNVRDYDSIVMSCLSAGRGFKIASQYAQLNSEQSEISMQFREDQRVRVSFVVSPMSLKPLIYVYVDGIMCGTILYPEDDNFSQNPAVGITVGAESSGIDVYRIALYTKGLTRQEILANYIADRATLEERINTQKRNDVLNDEDIVISKLPANVPYMIISSVELPQAKGNAKPCSITYVDPVNSAKSFTATGAQIDVQGTSSAGYKKKNFLISLLAGLTLTSDGSTAEKYALTENSIPVNVFCLKADVASSDNANNVELVRLYNDTCPYRHTAMGEDVRIRYGIEGYPIVVFWQNTATGETTFWGKYNFNNDKSTPEVFGFKEGYECWEIRNNTSNRVLFKTSDYGDGWEDDFEAVYPKKLKDYTNLKALTDWIASTDRDAVSTEAEKTVRLNKFRSEFEDHFVKDAMLYYYLFTETFLMVDNRAKNFFPTYDPTIQRWWPFPYDMDTAMGINNEGKLVFDYDLEDTDKVGTADVYNAQGSVLWNNVRDAFPTELAAMYVDLRNTSIATGETPFSYEFVLKRFTDHQSIWPEAVWNEDAFEKYLRPLFEENDASYLGMLQGNKASQRDWWTFNGFRYRDSKYQAGDANTNYITLRCYALGDITVTPYSHLCARIKYGSYTVGPVRSKRNVATTLENPNDKLNDTETYIYSADRIADIGDLSPLQVGYADFSAAVKLQKLKLGDDAADYVNTNLTELYVGNNDLLTELDVQNCSNLKMTVDLSGCDGLETVLARGSSTKGFTLPVGGHIRNLELPGTIANFTIRDQKFFESVTFEGYTALSTIRVENTPNIDIETLINSAGALDRVRLVGVEWEATSEETLAETITNLKASKGLDASGKNTDNAVVNGRVYVDSISTDLLEEIQSNFPELVVVANGVALYLVRYLNYDNTLLYKTVVSEGTAAVDPVTAGLIDAPTRANTDDATYVYAGWDNLPASIQGNVSIIAQYDATYAVRFYNEAVLLHTQWVQNGLACPDPITEGYIDTPTKESTAQYSYEYYGWDRTFARVTAPLTVNAVYTETVRTYTVYFCNEDGTVLQTVENVPYGSSASYTGDTPAKTDYEFLGWSPEAESITGDTYCYAQFRFSGLYSVRFMERTMSGEYENDRVTSVGEAAFYYQESMTSVSFPNVETVGSSAFYRCTNLVSANFPKVMTIGSTAFRLCEKLAGFDFTEVTSIGSYAFYDAKALTAARMPKATTLGERAFTGCTSLLSVDVPVATSLPGYLFEGCTALSSVNIPLVSSIGSRVFYGNKALSRLDLPEAASIGSSAFYNCSALEALILRKSDALCTLSNSNAFTNSGIAAGTGYIYVPMALVNDYKADSNWSTYAAQFRAIEDYPEITGG